LGVTLSAHLGERKEEIDALRRSFRKGILTILRDFGLLTPSLHLVHMNHGNAEDVRLGVEQGVTFVLCPRSTILKRTGYPLLRHIGNAPLRVCIGTDWEEPDMFREMQFLSQLSMLFSGFPSFAPLELVHMATINGAASLGKANEIGSLERGKKADFVILNLSPVHLEYLNDNPSARDLASLLVRNLSTADIRTVMVDGKDVFSNGICTHMDEESTVARFRRVFASMPGILSDSESPVTRAKIIPFVGPSAGRGPDLEDSKRGSQ